MKRSLVAVFTFAMLICSVLAPIGVFALDCGGVEVDSPSCPDELKPVVDGENKMTEYIGNVLNVLFVAGGVIAVIVIIYAGVIYMTSTGDPGKIATAKKAIMYAVVGLIISISAFAITSFLIGALQSNNGAGGGGGSGNNGNGGNSRTVNDAGNEIGREEPVSTGQSTIKVESLALPASITMTEGDAKTVTLTKKPSNATEKINWRSGSTSVATVNSNGRIVAKRAGSAKITAKSASGKTASINVTVKARSVPASSVSIVQGESVNLRKGSSMTLKANVRPSNTIDNSVTWTSSNSNIVSVDSNGKITAKKAGSATITAKTTNGKTDKIVVNVTGTSRAYPDADVTTSSTGNGFGKPKKIVVHKKNKSGDPRCGSHSGDYCVGTADVTYGNGKKITFYMGHQSNYGVRDGACRAHAFTAAYNATSNKKISTKKTIDLAAKKNNSNNPFRKKGTINYVANQLNANVKTYFGETSNKKAKKLAKEALDNGQPVVMFVSGNKSIAAGYPLSGVNNAHALLLLGENSKGKIEFMDSSNRFRTWTGKKTLDELFNVAVGDNTANSWMRMFIFSY